MPFVLAPVVTRLHRRGLGRTTAVIVTVALVLIGSVGIGSAVHVSAEKFRLAAGIDATHVPYRGCCAAEKT